MAIRAVFFDLYETLVTEFADGKRISKRSYDYRDRLAEPRDLPIGLRTIICFGAGVSVYRRWGIR